MGDWKAAWENTAGEKSDMDNYISFYSDDFNSMGLDKNGWKHDKESKGKNKLWIRIELSDIKISELKNGNQIEGTFNYLVEVRIGPSDLKEYVQYEIEFYPVEERDIDDTIIVEIPSSENGLLNLNNEPLNRDYYLKFVFEGY